MPHYIEVPFTPAYVDSTIKSMFDEPHNQPRFYDLDFLGGFVNDLPDHGLSLMGRVRFQFGKEDHQPISTKNINTFVEYSNAIIAAAQKQKLTLNQLDVNAIFAFTLSQQAMLVRWMEVLYPIKVNAQSTLEVNIKKNGNDLQISYDQREKEIGDYTEGKSAFSNKLSTIFKAKTLGTLKLQNNAFFYFPDPSKDPAVNKSLSIAPKFWEQKLLFSASAHLNQMQDFAIKDFYTLTPFLINAEFCKEYNNKLATEAPDVQDWAYHFIMLCFEGNPELKKILTAVPNAKLQPQPANPTPVIKTVIPLVEEGETSSNAIASVTTSPSPSHSRSSTGVSPNTRRLNDRRGSVSLTVPSENLQPNFPVPPPLSAEQRYKNEKKKLKDLGVLNRYGAQQLRALDTLNAELEKLTFDEETKHMVMLTEIVRRARIAITRPQDTENLNSCANLIGPLRKESLLHLALALTSVVVGALIVVVSTAVAVASFGGTTLLSSWGIAVGTSALTKGLAIAGSVLGLAMMGGGFYFLTHQPLKQIIAAADTITNTAVSFWKKDQNKSVLATLSPQQVVLSPSRSHA